MRQLYLISFFTIGMVLTLSAQQLPQYSLYMYNQHQVNPAYAGLDNAIVLNGLVRMQWTGLEGAPLSQQVSAHMPLYILGGGIGLNVENDITGAQQRTSATLSYNYWLKLSSKSILSLGIGAGVAQRRLDGTKLRAPEGDYNDPDFPVINHNDDLLPEGLETAMVPVINAGAFYQSEHLDFGISVKNILEAEAAYKLVNATSKLTENRHFYGFAAGRFDIGKIIEWMPSLMVQSDLQQTQAELTTLFRYNGNIFGGAGMRGYNKNTLDAVVLIAGFNLNERTTLAYAYDLTLSDLNSVSNGSHEITIRYNLNKSVGGGVLPPVIHNPRFL
ncbi:MAG: type IX secretion system PorP/SprF family membrane protein [Polaribacter sp.]|jgi:type IX secretion system PorP/SprF family membrane protein